MVRLEYDRGTVLVRGDVYVPFATYDGKVKAYRALAMKYRDIVEFLSKNEVEFEDRVMDPLPVPFLESGYRLRPYQSEAVEAWERAGRRGVIVMPTGAGKTLVGMKAMELVQSSTLVVVPTLELLQQWRERLEKGFGIEVGMFGGGKKELKGITVTTYDSAYIHAERLGNKFMLLIFDECHHLPAQGYRQIAELMASPYRLGLTATMEREDGLHVRLPELIGPKVYEVGAKRLAGRYLAEFDVERIRVSLRPEEKAEYERNWKVYTDYLKRRGLTMKGIEDFHRFLRIAAFDKKGREALLARHRALKVAMNSEAKLDKLAEILRGHRDEKTIIFTQFNELVHRISKRFLIPFITHRTSKEERREVLKGFREGRYKRIVSSKVLDEGVDVPDASLGIILAGTGSRREFIQRLGRLLRPKPGKRAKLIEIVSEETRELGISYKRRRALKEEL